MGRKSRHGLAEPSAWEEIRIPQGVTWDVVSAEAWLTYSILTSWMYFGFTVFRLWGGLLFFCCLLTPGFSYLLSVTFCFLPSESCASRNLAAYFFKGRGRLPQEGCCGTRLITATPTLHRVNALYHRWLETSQKAHPHSQARVHPRAGDAGAHHWEKQKTRKLKTLVCWFSMFGSLSTICLLCLLSGSDECFLKYVWNS